MASSSRLSVIIALTAATVGVIYGYDTGSIAGALLFIPQHFDVAASGAWRWMLGLPIPAALVLVPLLRLPDTPRWYAMRGRRGEALETLQRGDPAADAEPELDEIEHDLRAERGGSLPEMARAPYHRTTVFVVVLMLVLFAFTDPSGGTSSVLGFVGILFFTAGFNFGFGALVWVYASESFPARLRTAGASAMLTADLVANLLISRFFLTVFEDLGGTGTFALFLGLAIVSFAFIAAFAPETKGRPLEAIRLYWENGGRWPDDGDARRFTRDSRDREKIN